MLGRLLKASAVVAGVGLDSQVTNLGQAAEEQGVTNVTVALILAASGIPPDTWAKLGWYEAIADQFVKDVNGGTTPAEGSAAATAVGNKLTASAVSRIQGAVKSASPAATVPAC